MICKRSLCCLSCAFCHSRTRPFFFTLLQTSSHFTAQRSKSSRSRSPVTGSFASPNPPAAASEQQPGIDHRSAAALRSPRHGRSVRIRPPRLRSFRLAMIHGMPRYAMVCHGLYVSDAGSICFNRQTSNVESYLFISVLQCLLSGSIWPLQNIFLQPP